jgi:hypothetical protein
MADISGLLDTFFLSKQNPELMKLLGLSEEQQASLNTQQNIGTAVGFGKGVLENYNQGLIPAIAGGYFGGAAGRQAPVSNIIQQKKTAVDISKGLQELKKLGFETSRLEQQELGTMIQLGKNKDNPNAITNILINPLKFSEKDIASSPELNENFKIVSRIINKPISQWSNEDYANASEFAKKPTPADVAKDEVSRAKLAFETNINLGAPETGEAFLKRIYGPTNQGVVKDNQVSTSEPKTVSQASSQVPVAPKANVVAKQPPTEVRKEIPLIQSSAIPLQQKQKLLMEQPDSTASTEFTIEKIRRMRNTVRSLADNPNLSKGFGVLGVGTSFLPNTEAANIAEEIKTLKNQLFDEAIMAMRAASKTGAAVGTVSNLEGQRFENMRKPLNQKQTPQEFLKNLELLDKELEKSESRINNAYKRTYGNAVESLIEVNQRGTKGTKSNQIQLSNPLVQSIYEKYKD